MQFYLLQHKQVRRREPDSIPVPPRQRSLLGVENQYVVRFAQL